MIKEIKPSIIHLIMDRAMEINANCNEECRDFRIMVSPMKHKTLILRWTSINIENLDKPKQAYAYECFNEDGSTQNCGVNYTNQEEANQFYFSLFTLHQQDFCTDHKTH